MRHGIGLTLAAILAVTPVAAAAEVDAVSDTGFVSRNSVRLAVTPAQAWAAMLRPAGWWNGGHTYSGDPDNLTIDARAGGCFCEAIPASDGQIEHMRVLYLAPGSALRMTGGLGPLQGEAVTGVLTATFEEDDGQTVLSWEYVVGGYAVASLRELAPIVDRVVGEQLLRLAASLGPNVDPAPRRAP